MLLRIVEAGPAELQAVLQIERLAFGQHDEAELVSALIADPSAQPHLSLLAMAEAGPVGHVLFTAVAIGDRAPASRASILAPLAVLPDAQRQGVGGALIEEGARRLSANGVELLFVLGHPGYYTRHGFVPATPHGLHAPYPVVPQEAWMVRPLAPGVLGSVSGRVSCARCLDKPEYWIE